jgi:hypothetical protein
LLLITAISLCRLAPLPTRGNLLDEGLRQHQRGDGVDFQYLAPGGRIDVAEVGSPWTVDSGVTQQYIDRPIL